MRKILRVMYVPGQGMDHNRRGEDDCNRNSFAFLSFKNTTLKIQGSLWLQFSGLLQAGEL